jgi:glycosyltransferase involved in cell wall biosynthesis
VNRESVNPRRVCFVGGTRYHRPLEATAAKKFATLAPLGRFWVIGSTESIWPRRFSEQGTTFYLLPGRLWPVVRYGLWFFAATVLCAWCVFVHGVRIVVAQSPYEAVPAAVVKGLARLAGRRIVLIVESHGNFEASLFLQRAVRFRGAYERMMAAAARYGTRTADLLRAVSGATGRQLLRWAGPRPLVTFHTWTDLDIFFAAAAVRRPGTAVLYAGVLTPLKGVDVLIDALASADGAAELWIIGRPIDPAYAAALRRRAEERLPSRVHFIGHISQRDLAGRLAAARAFVLPSSSEGLPRVILEAMAVGVPVIATAVGGIPELVEDGVTGWLVPPRDPVALADRLRWILAHPDAAEAVGTAARAAALHRFSVAAYRRGYAELLARADEMLGPNPSDAAVAVQSGDRRE